MVKILYGGRNIGRVQGGVYCLILLKYREFVGQLWVLQSYRLSGVCFGRQVCVVGMTLRYKQGFFWQFREFLVGSSYGWMDGWFVRSFLVREERKLYFYFLGQKWSMFGIKLVSFYYFLLLVKWVCCFYQEVWGGRWQNFIFVLQGIFSVRGRLRGKVEVFIRIGFRRI